MTTPTSPYRPSQSPKISQIHLLTLLSSSPHLSLTPPFVPFLSCSYIPLPQRTRALVSFSFSGTCARAHLRALIYTTIPTLLARSLARVYRSCASGTSLPLSLSLPSAFHAGHFILAPPCVYMCMPVCGRERFFFGAALFREHICARDAVAACECSFCCAKRGERREV